MGAQNLANSEFFIIRAESALYFECGYSCDNAVFLRFGERGFFITDGRYEVEAKENINSRFCEVSLKITNDLYKLARDLIKTEYEKRINLKIVFDPQEMSVSDFENLNKGVRAEFVAAPNFHQQKRIIKSEEEISLISESQRLNLAAFTEFAEYLSKKGIGKKEQLLHFKAREILEARGKRDLSFSPIVGINANAAKPHALPSADKLAYGDLLLFDAGIKYKRYCSDATRTGFVDKDGINFKKNQKFQNKKQQKIYDIVKAAQAAAIEGAKPGMSGAEIDALARKVIADAGYGEFFVHSLGHGVGLDIHELPRISPLGKSEILPGMCFSIEPGIYIPGEFGVRIEDLVVMREDGLEILGGADL